MMQHAPPAPRQALSAVKRRVYIGGLGLGGIVTALYAAGFEATGQGAALALTLCYLGEIAVFLLLFLLAPRRTAAIEPIFFTAMLISSTAYNGGEVLLLDASGLLTPDKLGFQITMLMLWLLMILLGSFLALPRGAGRLPLVVAWACVLLLIGTLAVLVRPPEGWRFSYMLSYANALVALGVQTFLLTSLGRRRQQDATTDALTGAANRHLMGELLQQRLAHPAGRRPAIMLIDVDRFKEINDTHGHAVGDEVLVGAAELIRRLTRRGDMVARWGGDEFLVLLADADAAEAGQVAERIREGLAALSFTGGAQTTASIGVHCAAPGQGPVEALAAADRALYAAKQAGRNAVARSSEP